MLRCRELLSRAFLTAALTLGGFTPLAAADSTMSFDLPAESMAQSLRDFAAQAKLNLSYDPTLVAGLRAPAIRGSFTPEDALTKLLAGTALRVITVDDGTLRIERRGASTSRSNAEAGTARGDPDLKEIIVTGTHIRGATQSASPVQVFSRDYIDAAGVTTVQQFLETLPQNLASTSENTISSAAGGGRANNSVSGSSPDLRGLGPDSTLVLVNGHRMAPGNIDGSFVDVSMIPLAAIDRIEIVTDGASAVYGSDAVGGVVNIILRKHYDGAETRAQVGSVTDGSMHTTQLAQTLGEDWSDGSALLSYQYFDQTPLSAASRNYLRNIALPFDLLPQQVQHSVFANVDQMVGETIDLHGDLAYAHRATNLADSIEGPGYYLTQTNPARVDNYTASFGTNIRLPHKARLEVSATYSESDTAQEVFQSQPPQVAAAIRNKSTITSFDTNLDGELAPLPAGPLQYAIGAQYRRESFGSNYLVSTAESFYPTRNVEAEYVELHVPLLRPTRWSGQDSALELTLADREEHYSDFGSTNNPKVGAIWKSLPGLSIRGTYGTSFKAPLLSELNPIPQQVVTEPSYLFTSAPGGTANTLIVFGGSPNLRPERARTWTIGLDFKAAQIPGMVAKFTYYHIDFTDRIASASSFFCTCNIYSQSAVLGSAILQRNPPASLIQQYLSAPTYDNIFDVDPKTIGAIFDARDLNSSALKTQGLDFSVGYTTLLGGSRLDIGIDGTRVLTYSNQFTSSAPFASLLSTTYNPVALRLRTHMSITRGMFSLASYVNFTDSYTNINVIPYTSISSWTTIDAVVGYDLSSLGRFFDRTSAALSVINIANRRPPYVAVVPGGLPVTYDGENANALGRLVTLRVQKAW